MDASEIPAAISLSADDPFIKYLGYMYNSGIGYMSQAVNMLADVEKYKTNLDGYMKYTKLDFMLGEQS